MQTRNVPVYYCLPGIHGNQECTGILLPPWNTWKPGMYRYITPSLEYMYMETSNVPVYYCLPGIHGHQECTGILLPPWNTWKPGMYRCNRLRCPLARMSGLQCFNMCHNGHGITCMVSG